MADDIGDVARKVLVSDELSRRQAHLQLVGNGVDALNVLDSSNQRVFSLFGGTQPLRVTIKSSTQTLTRLASKAGLNPIISRILRHNSVSIMLASEACFLT